MKSPTQLLRGEYCRINKSVTPAACVWFAREVEGCSRGCSRSMPQYVLDPPRRQHSHEISRKAKTRGQEKTIIVEPTTTICLVCAECGRCGQLFAGRRIKLQANYVSGKTFIHNTTGKYCVKRAGFPATLDYSSNTAFNIVKQYIGAPSTTLRNTYFEVETFECVSTTVCTRRSPNLVQSLSPSSSLRNDQVISCWEHREQPPKVVIINNVCRS